jgi:trans-aconitate methyltransferase
LDLACGPGSIAQRLLVRFPAARAVAVDFDPVLMRLGQDALGDLDGRLRWVEADLRRPDWNGLYTVAQFLGAFTNVPSQEIVI